MRLFSSARPRRVFFMRHPLLFALTLMALLQCADVSSSQNPQQVYQAIMKEDFYSDKLALGKRLGQFKTQEARNLLLQLVKSDHYWDREAALAGLTYFPDPEVDKLMLQLAIDDNMVRDVATRELTNRYPGNKVVLEEAYRQASAEDGRQVVLDIIASTGKPEAKAFLKQIVQDSQSPDRSKALSAYVSASKAGEDPWLRSLAQDPDLRPTVLSWILQNGQPADLALFETALAKGEPKEEVAMAYEAVKKWAPPARQQQVYAQSLRGDDMLVQAGMSAFSSLRSPQIMQELCRLTVKGESQRTRMMAATRLGDYRSREAIPYMIHALNERFVPQRKSGWDAIPAFLTVGVVTLFQGLSEGWREKSFNQELANLGTALNKATGVNHGTNYQAWADWAILSGMTVDGVNIIQQLFSAYPQKRSAAVKAGLKLLQVDSPDALFRTYNLPPTPDQNLLALEVARQLILKGYLTDARF